MTELLFRDNAYLTETAATVAAVAPDCAVILDRTVFYPAGGGQPGDRGTLTWGAGEMAVVTAEKGTDGAVLHRPPTDTPVPAPGTPVLARIDWDLRHRHMRMHTALHLLSVVIPLPVTGGQIGDAKGRLDFDMPDAPGDKAAIEAALAALVDADHPVRTEWITDDALAARPEMVKTMAVKPPVGEGRVRLVRIGAGEPPVDLQPCGGTHVRSTGEIGPLRLGKIEKKGRRNRRVTLVLA